MQICLVRTAPYRSTPAGKVQMRTTYQRQLKMGPTRNLGLSASSGTGTYISTLLAVLLRLNCALHLTIYSTLEPLWLSTAASTQIRGLTGVERRYDISSNSPSGGINDMVRSFSNRESRTHWWNLTSSISIALPRAAVLLYWDEDSQARARTSGCETTHFDLCSQT